MPKIDEKYLQLLRDKNLQVSPPFSDGHALAGSVWVAKPVEVRGNCIADFESDFSNFIIDAPAILFQPSSEGWIVLNQEHVPILGVGDFKNVWQTEQEAVDDILDFYFGNPQRMDVIKERVARNRT